MGKGRNIGEQRIATNKNENTGKGTRIIEMGEHNLQ